MKKIFGLVTLLSILSTVNNFAIAESHLLEGDAIRINNLRVLACTPHTDSHIVSRCLNSANTLMTANQTCIALGYKGGVVKLESPGEYIYRDSFSTDGLERDELVAKFDKKGTATIVKAPSRLQILTEVFYGWVMPERYYSQTFSTLVCND